MIDYKNTKIYYIQVGDDKYYGHTSLKYLSSREAEHKKAFRLGKSFKVYKAIRELNLTEDVIKCVWVEDYPCNNVNEAKARERYWIEQYGTLNMKIPNRTREEYRNANKDKKIEYDRKYNQENKEKKHEYRQINKEKIKDHMREYREANKEKIQEQTKEYYEKNKQHLRERAREYQCIYRQKKKLENSNNV